MPRKSLMHHDIQKIISYHNFYSFFPICKRKEFKLFQLLESFKKKVLMHRPSIKLVPGLFKGLRLFQGVKSQMSIFLLINYLLM